MLPEVTLLSADVLFQYYFYCLPFVMTGSRDRQTNKPATSNCSDTAMERRRKSLEARLEHQTKVVKVLQRAIRIYLAKRRLARKQEDGVELVEDPRFEGSSKYVDNWRPASERREVRDVRDGLPQEDLELTKMKDAGLIPFYSRTSNTIRHRIGGPFALKIQFQYRRGRVSCRTPALPATHSVATGRSIPRAYHRAFWSR